MSAARLRPIAGAVPVLVMPFDEGGAIDEDGLRRELDFCLEAGAQAICFGVGSESATLTDAERARVWTSAARHLDGRLPLIAATSHASLEGTIALTRLARECGVDCAMVNPQPRGGERLVALFRDLSDRAGLPLMLQDAGGDAPPAVLLRAAEEATAICSLKLESPGAPLKIEQVVAGLRERGLAGGGSGVSTERRRITVLGGANGALLPEELERGSVGTMPFPALIDGFRLVCDRFGAADDAGGREAYLRLLLPHQRAVAAAGARGEGGATMIWLHKELFRRAGILRSAYCRLDIAPLPASLLEVVLRDLAAGDLLIGRHLREAG